MDPLITLLGSFLLLVALKVPIVLTFVISSALTILQMGMPLTSVPNHIFGGINSFPLLAVPFFLLLGQLMNYGGITEKLITFADKLLGHIRGGLGHVNVAVSMLFAGLSGSSVADTAGVGSMLIPAMARAGYPPAYTAAITAASSTLGGIIPPSIIMVIYGSLARVSIGALFLAGFVPGLLIGLMQMSYTYYFATKIGMERKARAPVIEMIKSFLVAFPPLLLPIIIIGGVVGGFFTATEAAAVAVVFGFFLLFVAYRSVSIKEIPGVMGRAMVGYSLPMMAVSCAGIFGWLIAYLDAPEMVVQFIYNITEAPGGIRLLIIAFLLLLGLILSPIVTVTVFLPILLALGEAAGMGPLHLGIITVLTLSVGRVTPPYGICLLVASQIAEVPNHKVFVAALPMIIGTIIIIIVGTFFSDLFLFVPKLMMPEYM